MGANQKEFPKHNTRVIAALGASLVAIGLGIGSGEFILWPYLSVQHGYGILWAALAGIALQVFLNIEIQRYAIVTGNSVVHGFLRVSRWMSVWLLLSTILGFGWPGFASGSAYLLSSALSLEGLGARILPYAVLAAACGLLVIGRHAYGRIELFFRYILPLSFVFMLGLVLYYFDAAKMGELIRGLIGLGEGYRFLPEKIDFAVLLGAFAYAGSGGNLLLGQGYYVLKKKHGMSQYEQSGLQASESEKSLHHFKGLRRFIAIENIAIFGFMGLLTILMLSYLGPVLLAGKEVGGGFSFLIAEAAAIRADLGKLVSGAFLLSGAVALFSVQLGVLDVMGRISRDVLGGAQHWYKWVILLHTAIGGIIFALGFREPLWLITVGAVCNALAMSVISFIVLVMNKSHLPTKYRPSFIEQVALGSIGIIYGAFFVFTTINALF